MHKANFLPTTIGLLGPIERAIVVAAMVHVSESLSFTTSAHVAPTEDHLVVRSVEGLLVITLNDDD